MKVSGQVTTRQTLRGSIGEQELLAFVRQTLEIPQNANVRFFVRGYGSEVDIDIESPIEFTVSWEQTTEPTPERVVAMRAVTPVAVDSKEPRE